MNKQLAAQVALLAGLLGFFLGGLLNVNRDILAIILGAVVGFVVIFFAAFYAINALMGEEIKSEEEKERLEQRMAAKEHFGTTGGEAAMTYKKYAIPEAIKTISVAPGETKQGMNKPKLSGPVVRQKGMAAAGVSKGGKVDFTVGEDLFKDIYKTGKN